MNNVDIARERCEYASKLLTKNNIPHAIKNADIGHINLLKNEKVVMSFWARTGRYIYTINPKNISNIVTIDPDYDRGIQNCINCYKNTFLKQEEN